MNTYPNSLALRALLVGVLLNLFAGRAQAQAALLWYASRSPASQSNWLRGDPECDWGQADCNPCVDDVESSFSYFFASSGHQSWDHRSWFFGVNHVYAPDRLGPDETFERYRHGGHIQGFLRTNSSSYKYFGSHSVRPDSSGVGSLFYTYRTAARNELAYIHSSYADNSHPSGIHLLGRYVAVVEEVAGTHAGDLRFFDVERGRYDQPSLFSLPNVKSAGGGLGIVKLDLGYLVIASAPGGGEPGRRYNTFYYVEGPILEPHRVLELGESDYDAGSQGQHAPYQFSENMTLLTECGTGQIYSVHTSTLNGAVNSSQGYWRLSRLEWGTQGPWLRTLTAYMETQQNWRSCDLRSAGTVHVRADHSVEFVCHEMRDYGGDNSSSQGQLNFMVGNPR